MKDPTPAAAAAIEAEARLLAAGIELTLGGEPTYVPLHPDGAEWTVAADGPTKLALAQRLARELQTGVWPHSTLLTCVGKRYEGEVNPRWALRLFTGLQGEPVVRWPRPGQPEAGASPPAPGQGAAWLVGLGERLGLELEPTALADPLDSERHVWAVPLSHGEPDGEAPGWRAARWPLPPAQARLSGAPGPAGLRLPLDLLDPAIPRQVLTLEIDREGWELFLPPLTREPLTQLLQAVADSLGPLPAPRLSGLLPPDCDGHWQVLGLTADPGVLEINLPVCRGWADYDRWLRQLEEAAGRVGLRSWRAGTHGRPEVTGGGNHLLWGGPSLERNPFFPRPAWLAGILRYWQHHPCLAYLFSHPCVGPAAQSPRPDEAAGDLFELELAYTALERAEAGPPPPPWGDHRELIGETLRHLHADRGGNNHRSEISVDKFWNPGAPAGCLGLLEFRALESMPHSAWSSAVALLWTALAAHLLNPGHRPRRLRHWGRDLHDRMLLPSQLLADLEAVLADLASDGLALDPTPFREIWEWRFPPLLRWQEALGEGETRELALELRPALEPWPLICDTPALGGSTSRFVDSSLRRMEIGASAGFRHHCQLRINGHTLELPPPGQGPLAVRYRHQRLYPCLHPAQAPQLPLELELVSPSGRQRFVLEEGDTGFRPLTKAAEPPAATQPPAACPAAGATTGRRAADDHTIDLRLLEGALTS
ncbi:MAG: transglutaminase family protein [Synechococcaceae cyanobacterium]